MSCRCLQALCRTYDVIWQTAADVKFWDLVNCFFLEGGMVIRLLSDNYPV
jgi:hypothetical protein